MRLEGRRIVLGVCGGIAAYKAVELCRRLMDAGAIVSPVMTENATRFVGPLTFAALASEPPLTTMWSGSDPSPHTALGKTADLIVVAPATARFVGSYALGLSDDLLSTTILATRAPVVICPAMHTEMWEQPAVQENIDRLRDRGVQIVEPEEGHLAGGDHGVGRLADVDVIFAAVAKMLGEHSEATSSLAGRTVLVTSGGTREPIDPVRFIGNRSSGRQGHAVAEAARDRGAKVVLLTASALPPPTGVEVIEVETAAEMHRGVMEHLKSVDALVMCAAVADFRPVSAAAQKLKKADGAPEIILEPTVDILEEVARNRHSGQVIVGFAAETDDLEAAMIEKLNRKQLDLVVANDVSVHGVGFEHSTNSVKILDRNGRKWETGLVEKRTVADSLLDGVERLLGVHVPREGAPTGGPDPENADRFPAET